jgi:bla regulator protein BlaR1
MTALNDGSALWAAAMWRACWQGGAAMALVALFCRVRSRLSPDVGCWLWRLATLKLLAVLVWIPSVDLPLLREPARSGSSQGARGLANPERFVPAPPGREPSNHGTGPPSRTTGCLFLWLLGVGVYTVRFGRQVRASGRQLAACQPLRDRRLTEACGELGERLGLRRAPRLLVAAGSGSPWLAGLRAPAIVLPCALLSACDQRELRLMLAHELAHLKRQDLLWGWLVTAAQGLFFFHPLVWIAGGEWRLAQEMACDDVAMGITNVAADEYAGMLLRVAAQRDPDLPGGRASLGVLESYHTLKRRLMRMKSTRGVSPGRRRITGICVTILGITGLIPWRVVAQQQPRFPSTVAARSAPERLPEGADRARRPSARKHRPDRPAQRRLASEHRALSTGEAAASFRDAAPLPRSGVTIREQGRASGGRQPKPPVTIQSAGAAPRGAASRVVPAARADGAARAAQHARAIAASRRGIAPRADAPGLPQEGADASGAAETAASPDPAGATGAVAPEAGGGTAPREALPVSPPPARASQTPQAIRSGRSSTRGIPSDAMGIASGAAVSASPLSGRGVASGAMGIVSGAAVSASPPSGGAGAGASGVGSGIAPRTPVSVSPPSEEGSPTSRAIRSGNTPRSAADEGDGIGEGASKTLPASPLPGSAGSSAPPSSSRMHRTAPTSPGTALPEEEDPFRRAPARGSLYRRAPAHGLGTLSPADVPSSAGASAYRRVPGSPGMATPAPAPMTDFAPARRRTDLPTSGPKTGFAPSRPGAAQPAPGPTIRLEPVRPGTGPTERSRPQLPALPALPASKGAKPDHVTNGAPLASKSPDVRQGRQTTASQSGRQRADPPKQGPARESAAPVGPGLQRSREFRGRHL